MITMNEYAKRRATLMEKVGPTGIVILPAAPEILRNGDAVYAYRQNSDFYYLTGFNEPEAIAVLIPGRKNGEFILFNRVRDKDREIWDGPRAGQKGACEDFLANEAFPIQDFTKMLPDLLSGRETVYYPLGIHPAFDQRLIEAITSLKRKIRNGVPSPQGITDIATYLHEMRLIKSEAEIATMQRAVDITALGHLEAMKICRPGMQEYELEAALFYQFQKNGARTAAYNSIVGAGKNACILHYISNNEPIKDGDLVLIDAGAEYQNYAADITRTFPANGKFTGEQRAIYELVLASQEAAIKVVKPGVEWPAMQNAIVKVLTQGLLDLGILTGDLTSLLETQAYLPFYMHKSGHWLGLDVHDAGQYRQAQNWRTLTPGMVFTIEPGLYIGEHPQVHTRWHHIGVRIEDDILVTETGVRNLSKQIPKTVADIENIMAQ